MKIKRLSVADLSSDPANARKHSERNVGAIVSSLRRFGQQKPIVVDKSGVVRAGNGTLEAARLLGWDKIDAVETALESSEATAYAIADNRTAELAEWDAEILAGSLEGLDDELRAAAGFIDEELAEVLKGLEFDTSQGVPGDGSPSDLYTSKIKAPIYEIKGDCPDVSDLYDDEKTRGLVAEIDRADLPPEVSSFLRLAAERHTSFHFRNIAEFYAHADAETQGLMERSALVIIDFDKAIENGFVNMTERLGQLVDREQEAQADA